MYLTFYGLREEPFRLTPDPRFIHLAPPHRNALLKLVEGVVGRKGLLVAVGPVGTGKTLILHLTQHVLEQAKFAGARRLPTAFLVNPTLSRDELLEAVLDEFEVPCASSSKAKRLLAFHEFLLGTYQRGGTALMMVDEAHLLSHELMEEIRLLTNIDTYGSKLLQAVLCGQPELASELLKPQLKALRQRIAVVVQLRPLTREETRAYVLGRMRAAGLVTHALFTEDFFEILFAKTSGVPRLINLACDNALQAGYHAEAKRIGPELLTAAPAEAELQFLEAQLTSALHAAELG